MAHSILDKFFDKIFDDEWVGRRGEKLTERELKWVRLFGRKGKILKNIYIPKDNGTTSEIDVIYITKKGIFVIESKNYSGWIFGDDKSAYWLASLPNGTKNRFYSPVLQNKTHIKWLNNYLNLKEYNDISMFSFIVFSNRCTIKKMNIENQEIKVIQRERLYANIRDIYDSQIDILSEDDIEKIYLLLKPLTNVDEAVKQSHIDNINKKYNKDIQSKTNLNIQNTADNTENHICPKCGNKLVIRTSKKGKNVGNQFYGCSDFPNCWYTEKI